MNTTNPIVSPDLKQSVYAQDIIKSQQSIADQTTEQTLYAKRAAVKTAELSDQHRIENNLKYKHDIENIQAYENMLVKQSRKNSYHGLYVGTNIDTLV